MPVELSSPPAVVVFIEARLDELEARAANISEFIGPDREKWLPQYRSLYSEVIADVTAKRRIVNLLGDTDLHPPDAGCQDCLVVYIVASAWAVHPDYDNEAWGV